MMEMREKIAQYAYQYDGDWGKIANALRNKIVPMNYPILEKYITVLDEQYPRQFKQLRYPPWILFYQGDITLLQRPMITIVGSRVLSEYGKRNTEIASNVLKKKFVIVSGLAKGADGQAHISALNNGHTIGVVGCGIQQCYPSCNRYLYEQMATYHLILSEYPNHVPPRKAQFPWRNRLLAALGQACIVSQATVHSGTMLTVNEAITLSKDVWCFPFPFDHEEGEGCNLLISQGANILYTPVQFKEFTPKKDK